jgi:tetratricopeptide (TPR) repeat protein
MRPAGPARSIDPRRPTASPPYGFRLLPLVLGALVWAAPSPGFAGDPGDAFARAESLIERGRFAEARRLAEARLGAVAPDGEEAIAWRCLVAESWRREGDIEEAETAYAGLAETAPGPIAVEASFRLAKCRLEMWDPAGARKALGTIDAGAERADEREELRAIAVFVDGKAAEAERILSGLGRMSDSGWHYLGLIAFNSGNHEAAVERFGRAIAAAPGDYYNHLYRATSLLELGRLDAARAAFRSTQEIADTPEVAQLLGRLELRAERFSDAEAHLRKAVRLSPDNAEAWFGLMTALRRQKKSDEAKEAATRFQDLHRRQQENLDIAYRLHQTHEAEPRNADAAERLARHYLATDDPGAAERTSWHAVRADPRHVAGRLALARTYARVGRYLEASVHYRRILRQVPEHAEARREVEELIRKHARRVDAGR